MNVNRDDEKNTRLDNGNALSRAGYVLYMALCYIVIMWKTKAFGENIMLVLLYFSSLMYGVTYVCPSRGKMKTFILWGYWAIALLIVTVVFGLFDKS